MKPVSQSVIFPPVSCLGVRKQSIAHLAKMNNVQDNFTSTLKFSGDSASSKDPFSQLSDLVSDYVKKNQANLPIDESLTNKIGNILKNMKDSGEITDDVDNIEVPDLFFATFNSSLIRLLKNYISLDNFARTSVEDNDEFTEFIEDCSTACEKRGTKVSFNTYPTTETGKFLYNYKSNSELPIKALLIYLDKDPLLNNGDFQTLKAELIEKYLKQFLDKGALANDSEIKYLKDLKERTVDPNVKNRYESVINLLNKRNEDFNKNQALNLSDITSTSTSKTKKKKKKIKAEELTNTKTEDPKKTEAEKLKEYKDWINKLDPEKARNAATKLKNWFQNRFTPKKPDGLESTTHTPVNNFNSREVEADLNKRWRESLLDKNSKLYISSSETTSTSEDTPNRPLNAKTFLELLKKSSNSANHPTQ